jgi:hypothetical protein
MNACRGIERLSARSQHFVDDLRNPALLLRRAGVALEFCAAASRAFAVHAGRVCTCALALKQSRADNAEWVPTIRFQSNVAPLPHRLLFLSFGLESMTHRSHVILSL